MTKDEWESLQTPGWAALKRYLRDRRERTKESLLRNYPKETERHVIYCEILSDLSELTFEDIEEFYADTTSNAD